MGARPERVETPTHAGGVVVRRDGGHARFLLVTARNQPGEWVLPKGHIENGESAAEAAVREVLEEAGVTAAISGELGDLEYRNQKGRVHVRFFLMEFISERAPGESRQRAWLDADETRHRLPHQDAKALVDKAETQA